jgi:hypothetical protein
LVAWNAAGANASGGLRIDGITFSNSNSAGVCVQGEYLERSHISDCVFKGNKMLVIGDRQATNVEVSIARCFFNGNLAQFPNSLGCAANMHGSISDCCATQCGVGFRLARFVTINHARIEVNKTGLETGLTASGVSTPYGGTITDASLEANEKPVVIGKNTQYVTFAGLRILGTGNTTTGVSPAVGLDHQAGSGPVTHIGSTISGSFSTAAVRLSGDGPVSLITTNAGNKTAGALLWSVTTPAAKIGSVQSNYP